jgi:hydroxypyruvate isomerase
MPNGDLGTTPGRFPLVANVSLLFGELPLLDRMHAAAEAGFSAVEMWWPFDGPVPKADRVDELLTAIEASGIPLAGLNLWAGDMPAGERGVVSLPDSIDGFRANIEVVIDIARRTGCGLFNALYGQRRGPLEAYEQDELAIRNLAYATMQLDAVGGTVMLEPLSRGLNGAYPIETVSDALTVIRRVREATGLSNIGLLFDTFHLTNNGENLVAAIERWGLEIAHVQLADAPGRGHPGSGGIDFPAIMEALESSHYRGAIAAEYVPDGPTLGTLDWMRDLPNLRESN